jgi:hypothetical protein
MKVRCSKPRGQRIMKSTNKIRPLWIEPIGNGWWFVFETGEWQQEYPSGKACCSSYYALERDGFRRIWSLKAAKRTIAKWNVPSGTWFRVSLPWIGYDFRIKKP